MIKYFFAALAVLIATHLAAQDENALLKQGDVFDKQFKESDALNAYTQAASANGSNIKTLVRCTELCCSIGEKQTDKNEKAKYFQSSKSFADRALAEDSNSAEANYAEALAFGKMTETETESKKTPEDAKEVYHYAERAVALNPKDAKANYILGKWHYEMCCIAWYKKLVMRSLYRDVPKPDIDSAIFYFEKSKNLDMYFVPVYLDLAKAYEINNKPAKEIDALEKLVKLPNRMTDDAVTKAEGQAMLDKLQ